MIRSAIGRFLTVVLDRVCNWVADYLTQRKLAFVNRLTAKMEDAGYMKQIGIAEDGSPQYALTDAGLKAFGGPGTHL